MKKLLFALILSVGIGFAQGPTAIQQSATRPDACTLTATNAASTGTITITPTGNQYVYICTLSVSNCQDNTGISAAATPTTITTTGLNGLTLQMASGGATAGSCPQSYALNFPTMLKSAAAGTAIVFTQPTFITHQTIRLTVSYMIAP